MEYTPGCRSPVPLVQSEQKCSWGFGRANIRVSSPCWSQVCPVSGQLSLCFPLSPLVHCTWGPRGHMAMEGTRAAAKQGSPTRQEPSATRARESKRLCVGDYVFPDCACSQWPRPFWSTITVLRCDDKPVPSRCHPNMTGHASVFPVWLPGECKIAAPW